MPVFKKMSLVQIYSETDLVSELGRRYVDQATGGVTHSVLHLLEQVAEAFPQHARAAAYEIVLGHAVVDPSEVMPKGVVAVLRDAINLVRGAAERDTKRDRDTSLALALYEALELMNDPFIVRPTVELPPERETLKKVIGKVKYVLPDMVDRDMVNLLTQYTATSDFKFIGAYLPIAQSLWAMMHKESLKGGAAEVTAVRALHSFPTGTIMQRAQVAMERSEKLHHVLTWLPGRDPGTEQEELEVVYRVVLASLQAEHQEIHEALMDKLSSEHGEGWPQDVDYSAFLDVAKDIDLKFRAELSRAKAGPRAYKGREQAGNGGGGGGGGNNRAVAKSRASSGGETKGKGKRRRDTREDRDTARPFTGRCRGCGRKGHKRADCPSPDQQACWVCGSPEHLAHECPKKSKNGSDAKKRRRRSAEGGSNDGGGPTAESSSVVLQHEASGGAEGDASEHLLPRPLIRVAVERNKPVKGAASKPNTTPEVELSEETMLLDTGSSISVASAATVTKLGQRIWQASDVSPDTELARVARLSSIKGVGGKITRVKGVAQLMVRTDKAGAGATTTVNVAVVDAALPYVILGVPELRRLRASVSWGSDDKARVKLLGVAVEAAEE